MISFKDVINDYMNSAIEGQSSGPGNLKIKGNKLVHHQTPICEKFNGIYILNNTRYSLTTGRLQKQLRNMLPKEKVKIVLGVNQGYEGSLADYLEETKK